MKAKLTELDAPKLLGLVADLYAASPENRTFLHARFGVGEDALGAYRETIARWVCPDVFKRQDVSIAKAKKAITDYRNAVGRPGGVAELTVFYCEQASAFAAAYGMDDEGFFNSLVSVFGDALRTIRKLDETARPAFLARLDAVRARGHGFGWGVGDALEDLWAQWAL